MVTSILIQEGLKCLHVCLPVPAHTAESHQTTALASFYGLYEKASASRSPRATGSLQTPRLRPTTSHCWFGFSFFYYYSHTWSYFLLKKLFSDIFYRKQTKKTFSLGRSLFGTKNNSFKTFILKAFIARVSLKIFGFVSNAMKTAF